MFSTRSVILAAVLTLCACAYFVFSGLANIDSYMQPCRFFGPDAPESCRVYVTNFYVSLAAAAALLIVTLSLGIGRFIHNRRHRVIA